MNAAVWSSALKGLIRLTPSSVMFPAIAVVALTVIGTSLVAAFDLLPDKKRQSMGVLVLACYVTIYLRFMILSRVKTNWKPLLLLEPFWSYRACLSIDWTGIHVTDTSLFDQIIINYLLYFPLACLLPFTWSERFYDCGWRRGLLIVTAFALGCSLITETTQFLMKVGYFEIDDLIDNTIGAGIGYVLYRMLYAVSQRMAVALG